MTKIVDPNFEMELAAMVDRYGLSAVLNELANICNGKADHIATNWQDAPSAKFWERDARVIAAAEAKVTKE